MKTLYIVRHAKSSSSNPYLTDFDRPIMEKGKEGLLRVIAFLLEKEIHPDLIISSHAVRAMQTSNVISHSLHVTSEHVFQDKSLYFGDEDNVRQIFYSLPSDIDSLMVVGHNPTMTNFVNIFLDEKIDWLPTSAVIALQFTTSNWLSVLNTKPEILFYIYPSLMKKKGINNENTNQIQNREHE